MSRIVSGRGIKTWEGKININAYLLLIVALLAGVFCFDVPARAEEQASLIVKVTDASTGLPALNARVHIFRLAPEISLAQSACTNCHANQLATVPNQLWNGKWVHIDNGGYYTNADGLVTLPLQTKTHVYVYAQLPGVTGRETVGPLFVNKPTTYTCEVGVLPTVPLNPITGYVIDSHGHPVPDAHVVIHYWAEGSKSSALTDEYGFYAIPTDSLAVGETYYLALDSYSHTPDLQYFDWAGSSLKMETFVVQ